MAQGRDFSELLAAQRAVLGVKNLLKVANSRCSHCSQTSYDDFFEAKCADQLNGMAGKLRRLFEELTEKERQDQARRALLPGRAPQPPVQSTGKGDHHGGESKGHQ